MSLTLQRGVRGTILSRLTVLDHPAPQPTVDLDSGARSDDLLKPHKPWYGPPALMELRLRRDLVGRRGECLGIARFC